MDARAFRYRINVFLGLALALNLALWWGSRSFYARWAGVPPVPSRAGAVMMTLGDPELAFRSGALTLQNLGDGGGQVTPLKDYDYAALGRWFALLYALDPASDHVPTIAALYFGGQRDNDAANRVIVDYLARVGQNPAGDKWRWLAHAAFIAQHRMNDLPLALDIAYTLAKMRLTDGRALPGYARQYPAFILKAQGDKAAARTLMEQDLLTATDAHEVAFLKSFLIRQLDTPPAEVESVMKLRGAPQK